jgi:hypothetical protein
MPNPHNRIVRVKVARGALVRARDVNHLVYALHRRQVLIQHGAQLRWNRAWNANGNSLPAWQHQRFHPVFVNGFTNRLNLFLRRFALHQNHHL